MGVRGLWAKGKELVRSLLHVCPEALSCACRHRGLVVLIRLVGWLMLWVEWSLMQAAP